MWPSPAIRREDVIVPARVHGPGGVLSCPGPGGRYLAFMSAEVAVPVLQVREATWQLTQQLGHIATDAVLAGHLGVSDAAIRDARRTWGPVWRQYLRAMGPGLVSGASDDTHTDSSDRATHPRRPLLTKLPSGRRPSAHAGQHRSWMSTTSGHLPEILPCLSLRIAVPDWPPILQGRYPFGRSTSTGGKS